MIKRFEEFLNEARSIGKVNVKKLKKIVADEWAKNNDVTVEAIEDLLPEEWYDTWESAHDEIRRLVYDELMRLTHEK